MNRREEAMKLENQEADKPILCSYKGIDRPVHPEVCKWHIELKDTECEKCEEAGKQRSGQQSAKS